MKRVFINVLALIILLSSFSTLLTGCAKDNKKSVSNARLAFNVEKPQNEEDFIAFSLEADKRLLAVHNVSSPSVLKQYNIKPVKIKTKKDLVNYLKPYWGFTFIDNKWREGSKDMPTQPFSFEKKDTGFLSASDVKYERDSDRKVTISGKVCDPTEPNAFRIRYMTIEKTKSGWRATSIQYLELEKELKYQLSKNTSTDISLKIE